MSCSYCINVEKCGLSQSFCCKDSGLRLTVIVSSDFHTTEADPSFGGLRGREVKRQDPPIERELHLALEDLFHGCTKKIKISRRVRCPRVLLLLGIKTLLRSSVFIMISCRINSRIFV